MGIKITIVTAAYNCARTIEQSIVSVIDQTYDNIEYIIIDGASTDGTVDIIRKYSDKIAYFCSEPDEGIYDALNKGIERATGDYIQILGADDALMGNNVISKVVAIIEPETDILSCAVMRVDDEFSIEKYWGNDVSNMDGDIARLEMPHQGMFVRTGLLKERNFDTHFKIQADYDFIMNMYHEKNASFQFSCMPVVYYSSGGASDRGNPLSDDERLRIYERYSMNENKQALLARIEKEKQRRQNAFYVLVKEIQEVKHTIFKKIGFWSKYRSMRGWRRHHCENRCCRWCGRSKGR